MSLEHDVQIEAVLGDYLRRIDAGETVDREALLSAHPEIATTLGSCLEAASIIESMAGRVARDITTHGVDTSISDETIDTAPVRSEGERMAADDLFQGLIHAKSSGGQAPSAGLKSYGSLARCAMGAVYLAFDTRLQRQVALKFPKFSWDEDPTLLEMFYREVRSQPRFGIPISVPCTMPIPSTEFISSPWPTSKGGRFQHSSIASLRPVLASPRLPFAKSPEPCMKPTGTASSIET